MFIRFSIENWLSFRDPVAFSMVASREKQHGERIPFVSDYKMKLLPVAAIYGGNASGKTNLFKAINFCKHFIVEGVPTDALIAVEPYRLDASCAKKPSSFSFELLIDEKCYEYSFSLTREEVKEEKLVQILKTTEKTMFHRVGDKLVEVAPALQGDEFLLFAFRGTRSNQLFLNNSVGQNVQLFRPIYNWFAHTLTLIAPDSRFEPFEQFFSEESPLYDSMNSILSLLDTGVVHLGGEDVAFESLLIPDELRNDLQSKVKEGTAVRLVLGIGERYYVYRKEGELKSKKLVAFHQGSDGKEVRFDIQQHESDGTQRVVELLPAFLEASVPASNKVYLIDEVDRSLHTLLTRSLLEGYLSSCHPDSRNQLIITTHDVLLMDQSLFRRDEMWVTERDQQGVSHLIPFSDYKDVRNDKDIRKSYLQGRLGGVPRILLDGAFNQQPSDKVAA